MNVTKWKTYIAAVGTTLTSLNTAWAAITLASTDDAISLDEIGSLTTALTLALVTIYGVWRAPYIKTDPNRPTVRGRV